MATGIAEIQEDSAEVLEDSAEAYQEAAARREGGKGKDCAWHHFSWHQLGSVK